MIGIGSINMLVGFVSEMANILPMIWLYCWFIAAVSNIYRNFSHAIQILMIGEIKIEILKLVLQFHSLSSDETWNETVPDD